MKWENNIEQNSPKVYFIQCVNFKFELTIGLTTKFFFRKQKKAFQQNVEGSSLVEGQISKLFPTPGTYHNKFHITTAIM